MLYPSQDSLFQQFEAIGQSVPGWCTPEQMLALYLLAVTQSHISGDFIEIGSWCGRSALALGRAAEQTRDTHLHCVDLFPSKGDWRQDAKGNYYLAVQIAGKMIFGAKVHTIWQDVWLSQFAPIYDRWPTPLDAFNEHISFYDLKKNVTPYKGNVDSFLRGPGLGIRCKLAYIDGSHDPEDVKDDLLAVERVLVPGAWICFDDAFTSAIGIDEVLRHHVVGNPAYSDCKQVTRKLFIARYVGH